MIRISAFADEISPDPVEQVDVLARHGIRHIEFRSIHGTNVLDLADAQHHAFRALLRDRDFELSAIGSPIGKIKANEPFEPHLERFERALDLAEFYACPRIRIFSYYIPEGDDPAIHRDEVLRRMAEKARIAADRGVTLFLENEKGIYGDTAARVSEILESVNSPALAHAFDPANYLEVGQSIDEAWALLRKPDRPHPRQGLRPDAQEERPRRQGRRPDPPDHRRGRRRRLRRLLHPRAPPRRRRGDVRLHRPRTLRRSRPGPPGRPRPQEDRLRLSGLVAGDFPHHVHNRPPSHPRCYSGSQSEPIMSPTARISSRGLASSRTPTAPLSTSRSEMAG